MMSDVNAAGAETPSSTRHILFVDDDPNVLDGLRDALRPRRHEWRMTFVTSGEAAVSLLEQTPVDIVFCDLRMPGMDGATLLAKVAQVQPDAVRIVLSGHADPATIGRVAAVAHQVLAKPSPIEEITLVIERAASGRVAGGQRPLPMRSRSSATGPFASSQPPACAWSSSTPRMISSS